MENALEALKAAPKSLAHARPLESSARTPQFLMAGARCMVESSLVDQ